MGAYSKQQFYRSGIMADKYVFPDKEGTVYAVLDFKRWGNKNNILAYFTADDGSKIACSAWQNQNYLGLPDTEPGCRMKLTFIKAKNRERVYLRKAEPAE